MAKTSKEKNVNLKFTSNIIKSKMDNIENQFWRVKDKSEKFSKTLELCSANYRLSSLRKPNLVATCIFYVLHNKNGFYRWTFAINDKELWTSIKWKVISPKRILIFSLINLYFIIVVVVIFWISLIKNL